MRVGTVLVGVMITATSLLGMAASSAANGCTGQAWGGNCSLANSGTQVDLGATTVTPGTSSTPGSSGNTGSTSTGAARPSPKPTPNPCTDELCRDSYTVGVASEVYPAVSISDLVSFRPRAAIARNEPAGVGIVGMPSNIVAEASAHELRGELLGFPVAITFVPVSFTFDYADATTTTTTTGGASWATLGQAEFTPTATSHSYRARGTYQASVTVNYSASVLFDDTYRRQVAGVVRGPATRFDIRIVTTTTALVDNTCLERPRGPGC